MTQKCEIVTFGNVTNVTFWNQWNNPTFTFLPLTMALLHLCVCVREYVQKLHEAEVFKKEFSLFLSLFLKWGSKRIFGDSSVTVAQWWRARHLRNLVIRRSLVRFRPKSSLWSIARVTASHSSPSVTLLFSGVLKTQTSQCGPRRLSRIVGHLLVLGGGPAKWVKILLAFCLWPILSLRGIPKVRPLRE